MLAQLSKINTIIFDLGGVIVDLHPQAVIDQFSALTKGKGDLLKDWIANAPILYQYETGNMTDKAFVNEASLLFGQYISMDDFAHAWNQMIVQIPQERLELMTQLRTSHKVLILSNTNAIHERYFDEIVLAQHGVKMKDLVDHAYYSHDIGLRKPDEEIYEYVIHNQNLIADEVLFLDDKPENISAAKRVGIQAHQVAYPDQIFEILADE